MFIEWHSIPKAGIREIIVEISKQPLRDLGLSIGFISIRPVAAWLGTSKSHNIE